MVTSIHGHPVWTTYLDIMNVDNFGSAIVNPGMFLSLDLILEYWIERLTIGLYYVRLISSTRISYRAVPGFATDCPCGVWCRGLTTLYCWCPCDTNAVIPSAHKYSLDKYLNTINRRRVTETDATRTILTRTNLGYWTFFSAYKLFLESGDRCH